MNKKIKIFLISIISLSGLFISFNNVSAQTVIAHCDYATLTGTVYPNGSATYAWFDWGTSTPPSNHTTHQGPFYNTTNYSEMISGLTPSTHYFYRAVAQNAGGTAVGTTKDFYTPACPVQTYTVTASAGAGGTISPSSRQVTSGNTTTFTVTPNSGYRINSVSGCNGYLSGNTYNTGTITSNCTVYASFSANISNPTVNLTADNSNVTYNSATYLRWTSTNATSCYASGGTNGWAGTKNTNGNFYTGNLTNTTTYSITCYGASGTTSAVDSVTVTVGNQILPTVNLTVDNTNLNYGESTMLRWTTSNATSCTASGAWVGPKNINGASSTGALYSTKTYTLTCYNTSGQSSDSVTVTVGNQVLIPIVDLTADNTNLTYGGSTILRWYTTNNPTSCVASGDWSGSKNVNGGYQSTGALYTTKIYNVTCSNNSGSDTDSVTVNVGNQVLNPTVNISANPMSVDYGGSSTLSWNSTNATSCYASGGWSGNKSTSGSYNTGALYNTTTFNITCTGNGGSASDFVTVNVDNQQNLVPTVNLTADNINVDYNGSTYLRWTSTNATSCSASGGSNGWSGFKNTYGNFYTGALTNTTTYTITCTNNIGAQATNSVTIFVNQQNDQTPTVTTKAATDIDEESATLNGSVDSNGGSNVQAWFEWGTDNDYGNQTSHINYGSTSGTNFDYNLDGLDSDETYYFRAVAQNNNGQKVYGNQKTFTTDEDGNNNNGDEPDVTTYSASDIENDTATLRGYVDTNGESTRRWFEWGTRSGSLNNETDKSSRSTSSRNFEDSISGLNSNTTYYFRAVAENDNGTDYGNTLSFRTETGFQEDDCNYGTCAPTAVTTMATNIGQTSARLNGLAIVNDSTYVSGYFEYGRTQNLGNITTNKNIGNYQSNAFFESVYNLASNTTYYYRAVVTNDYGTSVGSIVSFRTGNPITYTDTVTNTNTIYRNVTVVSNTNDNVGNSRPSLVLLSVNQNQGNEILMRGDVVEYIVNYKNVSSRNLRDIVLQISIPKELEFMETSRGYFSTENSTVVVNVGYLNPQEEGSVRVTVRVVTDAPIGKIVVVTANLAYTIVDNNTQEEVFAYAKNTIEDRGNIQLGALAFLFGNGFLPNSLLGWLLLILLIILIILAVRKAYYGPRAIFVPQNIDKDHI